jgi:hypothetical protein
MAVGEEKNEDGGASCEWAVIPLRRWRGVRSKPGESLLWGN